MAQQSEHNMHLEKEVCNCSRRTRWRSTVEVDRLRDCKMKDCKMKEYPGCSGNEMIYEGCKKKRVGYGEPRCKQQVRAKSESKTIANTRIYLTCDKYGNCVAQDSSCA